MKINFLRQELRIRIDELQHAIRFIGGVTPHMIDAQWIWSCVRQPYTRSGVVSDWAPSLHPKPAYWKSSILPECNLAYDKLSADAHLEPLTFVGRMPTWAVRWPTAECLGAVLLCCR